MPAASATVKSIAVNNHRAVAESAFSRCRWRPRIKLLVLVVATPLVATPASQALAQTQLSAFTVSSDKLVTSSTSFNDVLFASVFNTNNCATLITSATCSSLLQKAAVSGVSGTVSAPLQAGQTLTLKAPSLSSPPPSTTSANFALAAAPTSTLGAAGGGTSSSVGPGSVFLPKVEPTSEEKRLQERLRQRRNGGSSGDGLLGLAGLGVFVSGEYSEGGKDKNSGSEPGHDDQGWGTTAGVDYRFSDALIAGLAFNYAATRGDFTETPGSFSIDSYGGLVYATVTPLPQFFTDIVVGYGHQFYSSDRSAVTTAVAANVVIGDTEGDEVRASINFGYDFNLGRFTIGPRVGVNYKYTTVDGFTEQGAIDAVIYPRQTQESLTTVTGVYASFAISTPIGVLVPQLTAEYLHEFMNDQKTIDARLAQAGTPVPFETEAPDRNYFNVAAGFVLALPHGWTPFVNYRRLVGYSNHSYQTVTAGLRFTF
jgi:uncharacterized protein YhjY with autotransporter beta-barrel domain